MGACFSVPSIRGRGDVGGQMFGGWEGGVAGEGGGGLREKEVTADAKIRIALFGELPTLSQYFHVEKIYNVY